MVNSCMLVGGCRDRFLMCTPYRTLDRRRFGMRIVGVLLTLSASCVFPLWLHASLPRTYNWLSSLMSDSCLGLRPSAAMSDGGFPPGQAVSSAGCCNAFMEHTIALSFFELAEEYCSWHAYVFHPSKVASPAQLHLKINKMYSMLSKLALLRTSSFHR